MDPHRKREDFFFLIIVFLVKSDEHEAALQKEQQAHLKALEELKQTSNAEALSRFVNTSSLFDFFHKCTSLTTSTVALRQ